MWVSPNNLYKTAENFHSLMSEEGVKLTARQTSWLGHVAVSAGFYKNHGFGGNWGNQAVKNILVSCKRLEMLSILYSFGKKTI